MVSIMMQPRSIRSVLSPLLTISYMCGVKIAEFPVGRSRPCFSIPYILLLWSIYCFFVIDRLMSYIPDYSSEYRIYVSLNMFTALLSMFLGVYHDKKFRNCLKMFAVMDDTLEKLGTKMDCEKLKRRILWLVLGWTVTALLLNCNDYIRWRDIYNELTSIYLTFMLNYCTHISIIDDLLFASILGYIGLKFDQVNEHLYRLATENVRGIKRAWESPLINSQHCSSIPSSKHTIWIMIHLHLELRKISREINSIFQVQMTVKMVSYFGFIAEFFRELFTTIFVRNYVTSKRILIVAIIVCWLAWYICRLLLINYMCEKIGAKENATRNFINKISYFTCDVEIRENILQFLLQITQAPLQFYGLGLFQFGFRYLYKYSESILSLIIILIQTDRFSRQSTR